LQAFDCQLALFLALKVLQVLRMSEMKGKLFENKVWDKGI
jgi:hypothetical protein